MSGGRRMFMFSAAVFAVLRRGDEVLALRRSGTGWCDGFWSVPAGVHDGAEPLWAGAARELCEETGVEVDPEAALLLHVQHNFTDGAEWVGFYFGFDRWTGEPWRREPDKHDIVAWRRPDKIADRMIPYVASALAGIAAGRTHSSYRDVEG